jgi:hypothetical protein
MSEVDLNAQNSKFGAMLQRLGVVIMATNFNEGLKKGLIHEYTRKYKAYPGFVQMLRYRWRDYSIKQVIDVILANASSIFETWCCRMFCLYRDRLQLTEPRMVGEEVFKANFHYTFVPSEIQSIAAMIKENKIQIADYMLPKDKDLVSYVRNQILIAIIRALGPVIADVWYTKRRAFIKVHPQEYIPQNEGDQRPFDFLPGNIDVEPRGEVVHMILSFEGREY